MSSATLSPYARSGDPGLTRWIGLSEDDVKFWRRRRTLVWQRAQRSRSTSIHVSFAVAFSKMQVLSFLCVTSNSLYLPPLWSGRQQRFSKRARANTRKRCRICWIDRLQIVELSRRRWSEAKSIYYLEPAGFSHKGICALAERPIRADRREPGNHIGAVEQPLHRLPFPVSICRSQPPHVHRTA